MIQWLTTLTYRFYCFSYHGYHDVIHWSRCTVHNCRYSNIATCPIHSCRCHLLFETRYRFQGRHEMESFEGLCRDVIKKEVKKGHSKPAKKKRAPSASSAASSSSSSSSSRSSSRNSRNQGGGAGGTSGVNCNARHLEPVHYYSEHGCPSSRSAFFLRLFGATENNPPMWGAKRGV